MTSNFFIHWHKKRSGPDITDQWIHKYNQTYKNEALFISQKHFSVAAMLQDLNEDAIEMNLRREIDELLLQANMAELKSWQPSWKLVWTKRKICKCVSF